MDMKISPNSHTELSGYSNYRYPFLSLSFFSASSNQNYILSLHETNGFMTKKTNQHDKR